MSNCSGLTDEALETLANSIAASHAQEVTDTQPQDAEAAQLRDPSISEDSGTARAGNTSRFYIQVHGCLRHLQVRCRELLRPKFEGAEHFGPR